MIDIGNAVNERFELLYPDSSLGVFPDHISVVRELFLDRLTRKELTAIGEGLAKLTTD